MWLIWERRTLRVALGELWGWLAWSTVAGSSQPPWRWEIAPAISR